MLWKWQRPVGFIQKDSLGEKSMKEVERREGKGWAEDEGQYPARIDLAEGEEA